MTEILKSIILIIIIVALFSLFKYKAPHGKIAMKALGKGAILGILIQVSYIAILDKIIQFNFLEILGLPNGFLSSFAAGIVVPLALGVSPINAVLVSISIAGFGLIPGFIAGYLVSFLIRYFEEKFEIGLQIIAVIIIAVPLARLIAMGLEPIVNIAFLQIGQVLTQTINIKSNKNICKRI